MVARNKTELDSCTDPGQGGNDGDVVGYNVVCTWGKNDDVARCETSKMEPSIKKEKINHKQNNIRLRNT
jgi:hypothetical protein